MCNIVYDINFEVEICVFCEFIGKENVVIFLEGVDVLVDGIDVFEIDLCCLFYCEV